MYNENLIKEEYNPPFKELLDILKQIREAYTIKDKIMGFFIQRRRIISKIEFRKINSKLITPSKFLNILENYWVPFELRVRIFKRFYDIFKYKNISSTGDLNDFLKSYVNGFFKFKYP